MFFQVVGLSACSVHMVCFLLFVPFATTSWMQCYKPEDNGFAQYTPVIWTYLGGTMAWCLVLNRLYDRKMESDYADLDATSFLGKPSLVCVVLSLSLQIAVLVLYAFVTQAVCSESEWAWILWIGLGVIHALYLGVHVWDACTAAL